MNGPNDKDIMILDFKAYPFKYIQYTKDLEPICEQIISEFNKNNRNEGYINAESETINYKVYKKENEKEKMIEFTYKDEKFNIYANPKYFYYFFSKIELFKVYSEEYLSEVKMSLDKDYKIIQTIKGYFLYPKIYSIFTILSDRFDEEELVNSNIIELPIQGLDPFQIDDNDESKDGNQFNLIYNNERKDFIEEIKRYVSSNKIEPMMIVGNEGIGKSVSLKFYSLLKSNYIKLYINFEVMNKIGFKKYYLSELMRCFLPFDNTLDNKKEKFKQYIQFITSLVKQKSFQENNLFDCLQNLNFKGQKIIYILDQYKDQYLDQNFTNFKNKVYYHENKIIICCSLNDKKVKEDIFINHENREILQNDIIVSNTINDLQNQNIELENNKPKINLNENEEETELINFFDFYYFKKILDEKKENLRKTLDIMNRYKNSNIDAISYKSNNDKNNSNKFDLSKIYKKRHNDVDPILELLKEDKREQIKINTEKTKIYFNEIISIEPLIEQLNDKGLYICMNNFNFFPKYYQKFLIFKKDYNNKCNIYDDFLELQYNRIKHKLTKFFYKYNNENVYQSLISLKDIIINAKNNPINYKTLYTYSKIYPFKYLSMKIVKQSNKIYINDEIFNQKFVINYSFPFIEYSFDRIIGEYNNGSSIDINKLSGTAFRKALEFKICENIVTNKYFSKQVYKKYVWTTDILTEEQAKNKKKEIEEIKKKGDIRIKNCPYLDDIDETKPLLDKTYYIKPENQINYLVDSLMIIKKNNQYIMIVFQIAKYKNRNEIYSKSIYERNINHNIKTKFENLYGIEIVEIYFWFILSNECKENENICDFLNDKKLEYAFYSLEDKCFYKERSKTKLDKIDSFYKEKSKFYPLKEEKEEKALSNLNPTICHFLINEIEQKIIIEMEKIENNNETNKNINYEKLRNETYPNSQKVIISNKQKEIIVNILKSQSNYSNNIQLLYLFCIPLSQLRFYVNNENLIFIFKYKNKCYFDNKNDVFEIKAKSNKVNLELNGISFSNIAKYFSEEINYDKTNLSLEEIKDIIESPLLYMFKIYYIGKRLIKKPGK